MNDVAADTAQYVCKISGTVFQVLRFEATEEISQLFSYRLTLWSDNPEVDIESLLRQTAEITVTWGTNKKQFFGLVLKMSQLAAGKPGAGGVDQEWGEYTVDVVPTVWILSQKSNCRIFQNKSADQIIKQVLDERGMSGKYESKMGSYATREYCVQYRENDLAFISRLMEEEGIFFYFTHNGKEMMVLGDSIGDYGSCAPESSVEFKTASGGLSTSSEYLSAVTYNESAYIGKAGYKDFDYRNPRKPLKVDHTAEKNTDLEIYDYHPERYLDDGRGRALAKVVVEACSAWRKTLSANGTYRSITAGCVFTLSSAYRSDLDGDWLVVSVRHSASQHGGSGLSYGTSLMAIPASTTFRSFPRAPKPVLNPQTATVVGPDGEKIYMDDLGRAKVQFRWDKEGSSDEDSSCWIRVAQPYAGIDPDTQKKHGFQWHPLIGDEVVVDFLEGDPDNPLIVGSVYNADNTPPIKPNELIRSMILTPYQHRLLMDDRGAEIVLNTGANQRLTMSDLDDNRGRILLMTQGEQGLMMEDRSDSIGNIILLKTSDGHLLQLSEEVGGDARGLCLWSKDGYRMLLTDHEEAVRLQTRDGHKLVLSDKEQRVYIETKGGHVFEMNDERGFIKITDSSGTHSLTVNTQGNSVTMETGGDYTLKVGGSMNLQVAGSLTASTGGEVSLTCGTNLGVTVGGTSTEKVGGSKSVTVGGSQSESIGGSASLTAGSTSINTGTFSVTAGGSITMTASASVTFSAGASVTTTAAMVSSTAGGINSITGALVKIN